MFRRSTSSPEPVAPEAEPTRAGAKGRPTPSRREAEAASRARARPPRTRKEQAARRREARLADSQRMREAMRTGDERHLPARDRGPVRRFVRDMVDSRFSFTELVLPLMVVTLVMQYSGSQRLAETGTLILTMTILLVALDIVLIRFRVRRAVRQRFGDDEVRGVTLYAVMRSMQMKFMRLPKPQVKIGEKLDARSYR